MALTHFLPRNAYELLAPLFSSGGIMLKKIFIALALCVAVGCGEESVGYSGDGGHCVSCYETTNLIGDPAIVCNGQDGGVCY